MTTMPAVLVTRRVVFPLLCCTLSWLALAASASEFVSEFDDALKATVFTRPELQGRWRPQRSAAGFHISKFLGRGFNLPEEVRPRLDSSILAAPEPAYRTPLRFVINYADACCEDSQRANCESALDNSADVCISFRRESLGPAFEKRNRQLLESRRGAGFWVWKPYLIFKTLLEVQDGDTVMYSEFAAQFTQDLGPVLGLPETTGQDTVFFSHSRGEDGGPRSWSKGDVLVILDCYNNSCTDEAQHVTAAFSVWKKTEESVLLASYWMSYMEDPRVSSDMEDTLGFHNLGFHHQGEPQEAAVASLIAYKWKLKPVSKETIGDVSALGVL